MSDLTPPKGKPFATSMRCRAPQVKVYDNWNRAAASWEGMSPHDLAQTCEILRVRAGSHSYGLNTATSDEDFLGVMCEPKPYVMGLNTFETWDNNSGEGKNGPGDVDLTIHSVRKFLRLACGGNPNIIEKFFTHPRDIIYTTEGGNMLLALGPKFATEKAAKAYLGYLKAQREKATGQRTQRTQRPDLISEHGFDVKFAMHAVRLGYMGAEYLQTGQITMPMDADIRSYLMDVRMGRVTLANTLKAVEQYEREIVRLLDHNELRPEPPYREVNRSLIEIHEWWWAKSE